ncbi:MAG: hypothetical protein D6722_25065 [Bacteroidetes bacterium]|nr:MAG: hypothetical protein D6722_25065 [Bacteroidota bacterium]
MLHRKGDIQLMNYTVKGRDGDVVLNLVPLRTLHDFQDWLRDLGYTDQTAMQYASTASRLLSDIWLENREELPAAWYTFAVWLRTVHGALVHAPEEYKMKAAEFRYLQRLANQLAG